MARVPRILQKTIVIPLLTFGAGFFLGWGVMQHIVPPTGTITDKGVRLQGKYDLVSPVLLCSTTEGKDLGPYRDLQNKLTSTVAASEKNGAVSNVSIYFRDFKGAWLDINDAEQYSPASLLKVPLMIAYFKEAEDNPSLLSQKFTYSGTVDDNKAESLKSPSDLLPGSYTVEQLIHAMIAYSDNNATSILFKNVDQNFLTEVYTDLGLNLKPNDPAAAENITAKQYAYFFRILYNATYLTPEDSEKALEILTAVDFPQGLSSAVPAGIKVANKFGERTFYTPQGTLLSRELHDCGIIYGPDKPYLLCIMTRGGDFDQLASVIQKIGKIVYDEVK